MDMRGEVALLTRNIVIEAELQPTCPPENENCEEADNMDTFGGHIKVFFFSLKLGLLVFLGGMPYQKPDLINS